MTFETIYHTYKDMVYNLALQYVQNSEEAEEVAQDVFMKVYKKALGFKGKSTSKTWVYRITVNTSLDYIKAKNRNKRQGLLRAVRMDDDATNVTVVHFDHPGVALEQKEAIAHIFKGINRLSKNQKTIIILLKIEGLSLKEVSEILNINDKAAESLFQRAKNNLKKLLEQNE
jgi:RNA polymerase sigma factor (sigma-70 family)